MEVWWHFVWKLNFRMNWDKTANLFITFCTPKYQKCSFFPQSNIFRCIYLALKLRTNLMKYKLITNSKPVYYCCHVLKFWLLSFHIEGYLNAILIAQITNGCDAVQIGNSWQPGRSQDGFWGQPPSPFVKISLICKGFLRKKNSTTFR